VDDDGRNCFPLLLQAGEEEGVLVVGRAHSEMEANLRGRQRRQHQIQAEILEGIQVVDRLVILLGV